MHFWYSLAWNWPWGDPNVRLRAVLIRMKLSVTWKIFLNSFSIFLCWSVIGASFFPSEVTWFDSTWSLWTQTLMRMWLVFHPILLPFIWQGVQVRGTGERRRHHFACCSFCTACFTDSCNNFPKKKSLRLKALLTLQSTHKHPLCPAGRKWI